MKEYVSVRRLLFFIFFYFTPWFAIKAGKVGVTGVLKTILHWASKKHHVYAPATLHI